MESRNAAVGAKGEITLSVNDDDRIPPYVDDSSLEAPQSKSKSTKRGRTLEKISGQSKRKAESPRGSVRNAPGLQSPISRRRRQSLRNVIKRNRERGVVRRGSSAADPHHIDSSGDDALPSKLTSKRQVTLYDISFNDRTWKCTMRNEAAPFLGPF